MIFRLLPRSHGGVRPGPWAMQSLAGSVPCIIPPVPSRRRYGTALLAGDAPAPDYYGVLGVPEGATPEECRATFRRRIKTYSDVYRATAGMEQVAEAQLLFQAYRVLTDPLQREQYDAGLAAADPFESPEAEPTEFFISPFDCPSVNPTDWRLLLQVARDAVEAGRTLGPAKCVMTALRSEGAMVPEGAFVWLTPLQYRTVVAELEVMDADFAFEWHEAQVQSLLLRAQRANRRPLWMS